MIQHSPKGRNLINTAYLTMGKRKPCWLAQAATPAMLERFAAQQNAGRDLTTRLTDVVRPAKKLLAEQMTFGRR